MAEQTGRAAAASDSHESKIVFSQGLDGHNV
jgi:hypothetical protein